MENLFDLITQAQKRPPKTIAVAAAEDIDVLRSVKDAILLNIGNFILCGSDTIIRKRMDEIGDFPQHNWKIINASNPNLAAKRAVEAVATGKASILMKGIIPTASLLSAVLDRNNGLRNEGLLSHCLVLRLPKFNRLIFLSDAAMNIDPDIAQLKIILVNTVELARSLGFSRPKVAIISALETVNPKIPSTVKAQAIKEMHERGEIVHCDVDGPMALDVALDHEAAKTKGIKSVVAGAADVLIVPYIEVGNALYKGWIFGTEGVESAGIVLGAKSPIILTSRADSHQSKLYSIALSQLLEE